MKRFFKKRKKLKIAGLVLLGLMIIAFFIGNHYAKKYGYRNIWHFVTTVSHNYTKSKNAKFETLDIEISDDDYDKLSKTREKALKRGILVDEEGSFVNVVLKHKGKEIDAKIRLKGHMTDHLQEDKWSFRVVTKKNDAFMGMKRFSLQHPGTRNYIYEWIYHQMMKQEGIVALRYHFIKLRVNKKSWGIYALEEHFSQQLVENNERIKGPIIRFNPEMYWSFRINELNKVKIKQEHAAFQSSYVEAYDDNSTYEDSTLLERYAQAVLLMEGFRRGELKTSEVFDINKLAKFHAIIDLVGGHHSLDWSDVKYYYNSVTNKLEPVAYESFSIRNTANIAGAYKLNGLKQAYITDLHQAIFSDPEFFELYIAELQRIATKQWLDKFLKSIDQPLNDNLAILYKEFPYKDYTPKDYYRNIKNIQQILNASKGFHAFVNHVTSDSLYLDLGGIDALPYEVLAVKLDETEIPVKTKTVVPAKTPNAYVRYKTFAIALPADFKDTLVADGDFKIVYRLLGKTGEKKEAVIVPVPAYDKQKISLNKPNAEQFDFVKINEDIKEIRFTAGKHQLSQNLVIPAGYKVFIAKGTTFDLQKNAGIVSYSPMQITGTTDEPVYFTSSDSTGNGLGLVGCKTKSTLNSVFFLHQGHQTAGNNGLMVYESDIDMNQCMFGSGAGGLHIIRSTAKINQTVFDDLSKQAFESDYARIDIKSCKFLDLDDNALSAKGSSINITGSNFENINGKAMYATGNTEIKGSGLSIRKAKTGIESKDASRIELDKISVTKCKLAFKANKKGDVYGPATIRIKSLTEKDNEVLKEEEKKSTVTIQ